MDLTSQKVSKATKLECQVRPPEKNGLLASVCVGETAAVFFPMLGVV